jgi:hypothetical protein
VLLRTPKFAVALRPAIDTFCLYFLEEGRRFDFRDVAHWQLFLKFFGTTQEPHATLPSGEAGTRVQPVPDGWQIARRMEVPIECDVTLTEFTQVQQVFRQRGVNPAAVPVNVGAVLRELRIIPTRVSCPVDQLVGRYNLTAGASDGSTPLTLTLHADQWTSVVLSKQAAREFCEMARMLYTSPRH